MSFCGYALFVYKDRYTNTNVTRMEEKKPKIVQKKSNGLSFIREIYKVKPETGGIDYFNCDCVNFPEYIPENSIIEE